MKIQTDWDNLKIVFSNFSEPYVIGGQPNDDRVFVQERTERAPDYTEGEQE